MVNYFMPLFYFYIGTKSLSMVIAGEAVTMRTSFNAVLIIAVLTLVQLLSVALPESSMAIVCPAGTQLVAGRCVRITSLATTSVSVPVHEFDYSFFFPEVDNGSSKYFGQKEYYSAFIGDTVKMYDFGVSPSQITVELVPLTKNESDDTDVVNFLYTWNIVATDTTVTPGWLSGGLSETIYSYSDAGTNRAWNDYVYAGNFGTFMNHFVSPDSQYTFNPTLLMNGDIAYGISFVGGTMESEQFIFLEEVLNPQLLATRANFYNADGAPVPEPSSLLLLGGGTAALLAARLRRRRMK